MSKDTPHCFKCCATPRITFGFVTATLMLWTLASLIYFVKGANYQDCENNKDFLCSVDGNACREWECVCVNKELQVECIKRPIIMNPAFVIAEALTFIGVGFLVISFASCCCFGCWEKREYSGEQEVVLPQYYPAAVQKLQR